MDLPSCPSCGQSVLDDDAEDCPFCGASMSGKPGAKPATASTSDNKPAGPKKRQSKQADSEKSSSDDPFDLASPVTRKVVQLLPKPAKGKVHRIVCPMCETTGFQSKKAAGREVRCSNKECLVPIFTAPSLEGEEKPEVASAAAADTSATESEPKKLSIGAYIGIAVAAALILGGGAIYFTSEPAEKELTAEEQLALKRGGSSPVTPDTPDQVAPPVDSGPTDTVPVEQSGSNTGRKGPPVAEMRETALRLMEHTSLQRDRNQRKPFCRRLTAEAFALAGDFDAVQQQLTQLDKVGPQLKYYRILPLVQVAWKQLESGNAAGATASVQEALPLVADLPAFGTLATDTVTELSTLLVAMDRAPEAIALLNKRNDSGSLGQFLESRSRSESTSQQPFDVAVSIRPVTGWSAPQWVSVVVSLTTRGMSEKALAFATSAPDQVKVVDCLSGWAEASLIVAGDDGPLESIGRAIQSLDRTAQSRIHSRCALTLHSLGKPALATAPLSRAKELLPSPGEPFTIDLQRLKSGAELDLPDAQPVRRAVLAAAELAHAQAVLDNSEDAWNSTLQAMNLARTMAPALPVAEKPFAEIKQRGEAAIIEELKSLRNLLTDDEARIAYQNYRNRSRQLLNAAQERLTLQEQVLTEVLDWGFADQIWDEIRNRSDEVNAGPAHEPWFDTNLVKALYNSFRVTGQNDKASAVESAVTKPRLDNLSSPRVVAFVQATQKAMSSTPEVGAAVLASFLRAHNEESDKRWQQETMLRLVSRLVSADRHRDALKLIAAIQDVQTRELAYELAGQEITARGHRVEVFDYARTADIIPPERIALLRGFIGQLPFE